MKNNNKLKQKISATKYDTIFSNTKTKPKTINRVKAKNQNTKLKKAIYYRNSQSNQKYSKNPSSQKTNLTQSTKELNLLRTKDDITDKNIFNHTNIKNQRITSFDLDNYQTTKFKKSQKPNKQYFGHFQRDSNLRKYEKIKKINKSPPKLKPSSKQGILKSYRSNCKFQKVDQYKNIKKSMKEKLEQLKTLQNFQQKQYQSIESKVSSSESGRLKKIFSLQKLSLSNEINKLREKVKYLKSSPTKDLK